MLHGGNIRKLDAGSKLVCSPGKPMGYLCFMNELITIASNLSLKEIRLQIRSALEKAIATTDFVLLVWAE